MKVYWAPFIAPTPAITQFDYIPDISNTTWPEPESLLKSMPSMYKDTGIHKCPAFIDQMRNTFVVKSPVEFSLRRGEDNVFVCSYDSRSKGPGILYHRDVDRSLYSLQIFNIFIPEIPTMLNVRSATYSQSPFARSTMLVGGEFDVGKFPRAIECAFFIPPETDNIKVNCDDPLFYATFTPEDGSKVELEKFVMTQEIYNVINGNLKAKNSKELKSSWRLADYYRMYKNSKQHNYLLKKVKENLLN